MEIDPATQKDAGFYECQANNKYALDFRAFRTDYAMLTYQAQFAETIPNWFATKKSEKYQLYIFLCLLVDSLCKQSYIKKAWGCLSLSIFNKRLY